MDHGRLRGDLRRLGFAGRRSGPADISYIEAQKKNLKGIIITHAHEDHYGALNDLWPGLNVPVYASAFTAGMLEAKRAYEGTRAEIPITPFKAGDRIQCRPLRN